ncbi:uncharacterized mitochondrial protein-like protein, partial [Tanacetum coccineum]
MIVIKIRWDWLIDREKSASNLKKLLMKKPRMRYQIEASTNTHDSTILDDSLRPKEKDRRGLGELAPTKLIIELADRTIKRPKGIAENVLVGIDKFVFLVDFVVLDMPEDIKVLLILKRPFLSTAQAKIDVFKRRITLRVGDDKIMFKNDKPTSNIIKRVFALGLRERMKLDLEARLMGEALILNRSLDPMYGDYIKLNDLNEPLELRRNQVEYLGPMIEDGEVIDKPMEDIVETRNDDNEISNGIDEYPSFCDFDWKIHIDCAYNLQFSSMIGYSSKNYVRKFLRALHPKWRAKVTAIEESKDFSSLALDELIDNLKVHEVVMEKYSKIYKGKKERIKSIALKAKKESSDDETSTFGRDDEEYAMA